MASAAELALLFTADASAVDKAMDGVKAKAGGLGDALGSIGGVAKVGLAGAVAGVAAIGAGAVAAGGALLGVGMKFDEAFDNIAVQTGATGERMDGLKEAFKGVVGNTPADFETVSAAIGTLGQRMDIVGDVEALGTQIANLATVTGGDAAAAAATATDIFAKFGVAGKDQTGILDALFVASQKSGVGFDTLSGQVSQFAPQLQSMGLDAKAGAGLLAELGASGVDAGSVMPGISKALMGMAKDGIEPVQGLQDLFAKVAAEGPNSATAVETFGKSGLAMAAAIQSGAFEVGNLVTGLEDADGAINKTAAGTADFAESWAMAKNKIMVALEPLGSAVMGAVTEGMNGLMPLVDMFTAALPGAIEKASNVVEGLIETVAGFVFPDLDLGGLTVVEQLGAVASEAMGALKDAIAGIDFAGIFGQVKDAIAGIDWVGIGASVMAFVGAFKDGLMVVLPIVAAIFQNVLMPIVSTVFGFFQEHTGILVALGAVFLALTGPIGAVVVALTAIGALGPQIGEWVSAIGTGLVEGIGGFVSMVVGAITAVCDAVIDAFKSFFGIASPSSVFADFGINLLEGLVNGVLSMIATVISTFGSLGDRIFAAWESIKVGVMAVVEMIRVMISAKWDAIGEYLSAKLDSIGKAISDAFDAARAVIETMVSKYLAIVTEAWGNIFDAIDTALGKVRGVVDSVLSFVEEKTGLSMGAARQVVSDVIGAIEGFFDGMKVVVSDVIGAVASLLTGDFSGAVDGMKRAAEAGLNAVMGLFAGLGRAVMDAIGNARDLLVQVGTDLIEGLRAGISKSWDAVTSWLSGLFGDIVTLAKKILGIASPSKVMRDQVGQPIAMGIVEGIRMTLAANPIAGLVAGWAQASNGASIGAVLGGTLKAAVIAGLMLSGATNGGALIEGRHAQWGANATPADGRMGLQKGPGLTSSADDGRVRADAFRSGKGGLLAASSSNYWQVFVAKWGVPTEASAIKVSKQLGIPLPQWLTDIYHPPSGETVDRPDVLKDPAAAQEAGAALKQLAKAGDEAVGAFSKIPPAVALLLDDLKNGRSGSNPIVRPLPGGGGIGGPIPIPGPGGTTTFGGAGGGVTGATISAQTVTLRGPVNIGMNATLAIGGGRTLTATLVDALITDTASFDKLIQAEDRRRAQT